MEKYMAEEMRVEPEMTCGKIEGEMRKIFNV